MQLNWIDVLIMCFLIYRIVRGWQTGILYQALGIISYGISWVMTILYTQSFGVWIGKILGTPESTSLIVGAFFILWITDWIFASGISYILSFVPKFSTRSVISLLLGSILSLFKGIGFVLLFSLILLSLPQKGSLQKDFSSSASGQIISYYTLTYFSGIKNTLIQKIRKTASFLTVYPESEERILLDIPVLDSDLYESPELENDMIERVNFERHAHGVESLQRDDALTSLARQHSRDMFQLRYFSHMDFKNQFVSDRAGNAGISYTLIGENLAYSPDLSSAHEGLMNSISHRENILNSSFRRIGIGIVKSDGYGLMVTQVFAY